MHRTALSLAVFSTTLILAAAAQRVAVGVGVLLSNRPSAPSFDLHIDGPPLYKTRAELTLAWNDKSAKPTVITELERSIIDTKAFAFDLGAGLLWLDANEYRPFPAIISTTVVPLPIPRLAIVAIGSTQPFQDFEWSLVLKGSMSLWSGR
ncbi:MAG: hypothetical protein ACREMI_02215 [Gemmatimonadales bacterium]